MAKIALCGYGSDGRGKQPYGDGYAYVVDDNVRVGDRLQVVATNWKSGKKFATTASPLNVYKENSVNGQYARNIAEYDMSHSDNPNSGEILKAYTGKEMGVKGFKGSTEYQDKLRAKNLEMYAQSHPNQEYSKNANRLMEKYESFDEYSAKFKQD